MMWKNHRCWAFHDLPVNIPYFLDTKSTTERAYQVDPKGFEIDLLHTGLEKAMPDEALSLGISVTSSTWIREVELSLLSTPVMFARTVVPYLALETTFRQIKHLGNQSLGCYLFKLPGIKREPFKIKQLLPGEKLYERMKHYADQKQEIWARRSVFRYKESPLLLTEVFLPQYNTCIRG